MNNTFSDEVKSGARFEFGKNWKDFLNTVSEQEIQQAAKDIKKWLDTDNLTGKRIIDIGSGSGIHSFALYSMGADELISFDYDNDSVEATTKMWENARSPANWKVIQGSVLDDVFIKTLGSFDIVYSWGVLHHTGEMWKAIGNAISLVKENGIFWFSIYQKGPGYNKALKLKTQYNNSSSLGKKIMVYKRIIRMMIGRFVKLKNPFAWNRKTTRGMNVYNDLVDWLGGLPYEVASKEEITDFCNARNLELKKIFPVPEGACSIYLFQKK
jgi:2-polyprenyl-6-hydroxyphenyl methylase/3-demethylubiquinone-9 3-methyltransferase